MEAKLLKISKALSDETRLKILKYLLIQEKCVCQITPHIKKAQPTISLQLRKLEDLNLIKSRKEGNRVFYSIKEKKIKEIFDLFNVN